MSPRVSLAFRTFLFSIIHSPSVEKTHIALNKARKNLKGSYDVLALFSASLVSRPGPLTPSSGPILLYLLCFDLMLQSRTRLLEVERAQYFEPKPSSGFEC